MKYVCEWKNTKNVAKSTDEIKYIGWRIEIKWGVLSSQLLFIYVRKAQFFFVLDTVFGSVLTSPGVLFYFSHSPTEHQANPYLALITLMQAYGCSWLLNGGSKESPSQQRH